MAATRKRWYVGEDGCIPIGEPAASVTYHSSLSSIIVATKEPAIKVYDVTSGSVLQKSNLSAAKGDALHCAFLPKKDRIFFSDSRAVGVRKDLHGVLMLDTALQTPVAKTEEIVKLELPLAEAVQLLKSLSHAEISGIDFVDEVIKELGKQIEIAQDATKGNHKTIKWATVCLELQHCALKNVCSSLVAEMRRLNQHSPGLSIASTVTDRLGYLLPSSQPEITGGPVDRTLMYSEAARRETFSKWPHMNYKWALPEPMAQAGFYHQPNSSGDDRAMCFTCSVCLVCWEPTDEPWSEHERHSPSCPYVKGEHTQNVPLSVTYATQPAMTHGDRGDRIECVSSTSCDKFVATSTRNGHVVIWDIGHILKKYSQFSLDPSETVVALKTGVQVERCSSNLPSHSHHQQQEEEKDNNPSSCKFVDSLEKQPITSLPQGAEGLDSTDAVSVKTEPSTPVTFTTGNDAMSAGGLHDTASEVDFLTPDVDYKWKRPCEDVIVSSLCLVEKLVTQSSRTSTVQPTRQGAKQDNVITTPQPTLICGVSLRKPKLSINSEAPRHDAEASRTTDVQLMNKVNEVVSGDHSLQIIISSENNSDQCKCSPEEEILNATSFLPYILVTSVCEDNTKLTKLASTDSLKPVLSTSNIVPTLGALTMNQDWDLLDQMYYSDPDPDVQIIGFTPGPSSVGTSGPTEAKFAVEGGYEESQGKTSSSIDGAIRKVTSIPSSGTILQCVELPEAFHFKDMEVRQILPTPDGHHILVIVSNKVLDSSHSHVSVISDSSQTSEEGYTTCCENSASAENASVVSTSKTSCSLSKWGGILCYRLEFDSDCHYASINESPLAVYCFESADSVQTAVLLPQDISDQSEDELTDLVEGETSQGLEASRKPVGSDSSSELQGLIAVIFSSGKLSVYTVNNFSLLAEISPPEEDRFTGVTYCSGLDRLCVCSALGKLYLYQLSEDLPESMENLVEAGGNSSPVYPTPSQAAVAKLKENRPSTQDLPEAKATAAVLDSRDSIPNRNRLKQGTGSELLAKQDLSFDNLVLLHQLTRFENLLPRFTATVPPCWNEIQQEQQQRRHPQHLQHQGEASQHTRTWKLQTDSNTWDEHLFEIVLPRMCCVGHVDVKFSFHPLCTSAPHIEMTLLKQNVSNLGRQSSREKSEDSLASCSTKINSHRNNSSTGDESGSIPVDNPINFGIRFSAANDMDGSSGSPRGGISARNSVLDPLFLESHNAEILCGPINIATCLDLSGNCGQVSLTSPQLLLSKPRSFLLHIKGFQEKTDAPDKGKESRKRTSAPTSDKSKAKTIKAQFENYASAYGSASISGKLKLEHLRGCDWIQEISVTIRKTKKTHLQKDRLQRNAMLELTSFHEKLISIVALDESSILPHVSPDYLQNLVLDILMWITFIQMHDPDRRIFSKCILMTLQKRLGPLVKACFIQGTRTTAHKCARLMALCMEFCKSAVDPNLAPSFSLSLLEAIMESLPLLPCAYSSGAVKWYFTLLNRVKCMDIVTVSESCADLLKNTAKQYHSRTLPGHALLRSRYGVYGHPFEPDLFDMDLPVAMKQCQTTPSVPASYASVVGSTVGGTGSSTAACDQQEELDFYDLFIIPSEKSSKAQIEYARNSILGMLEVEPLHFTCHSTSDGTKMEKLDSAGNNSTAAAAAASTGLNPTGLTGTINFGEGLPPPQLSQMSGTGMAYSLQSTMASAKHQLQELSMKNYPTVKHKIMHIKQILSEVGKAIPQIAKSSTASAELVPSTPKTTPQVMTPPLTPPNEAWHQLYLGGSSGSKSTPSGASQQQQQQQHHQQQRMSVNVLQTQALLQPPTPQVLVVERMHSGARRFVILDFGKSILLTDVIIPACADLASLSIDVWVQQEEVDGQRLIVASDIGSRSLVMNDIMPPPVCRFLKLTTIGRYGSGTTRSRIPIGAFYGHSYILPWEWNSGSDQVGGTTTCQLDLATQSQLLTQLGSFLSLQEDIQCRYSLSRTRLENLLSRTDSSHYTTLHTQYYLQRGKKNNDEDNNIIQAYNECLQLQLQQNLAQRAIDRLKNAIGLRLPTSTTHTTDNLMLSLKHATIDKLRFLLECLLEVLLISTNPSASIPQPPSSLYTAMAPQGCEALFKHLCVHGTRRIQILASMLLVRVCGSQKWFGDFMGNMLQEFFQSDYSEVFPQDRLFVLLLAMGQRTLQGPAAVSMMESILGMLAKVLSPMSTGQQGGASALQAGNIDLSLVGWILLFLCRNLDNTFTSNGEDADRGAAKKDQGNHLPNRWNFIQAENTFGNKVQKSKSVKLYRRSLQKRLMHHKQKLIDLEQVKQSFMWQGDKSSQNISNSILKQQEKQFKKELSQYASKHLKDIIQIRKTDAEILRKLQRNPRATAEAGSDSSGTELDQDNGLLILPKTRCLSVVRGLIALLLGMDFTCNVDLFLITCKVLARICVATRPAICLVEVMSAEQLKQLILLTSSLEFNHGNISWGGPWAGHALTCLLQDILEGERLYPVLDGLAEEEASVAEGQTVGETDDILQQSGSLSTFEESDLSNGNGSSGEETVTQTKDDIGKLSFEKESSLMVDMLLDEEEYDDDTSDKLHAYVTGESIQPPLPPPPQVVQVKPWGNSSMNGGTLDMNNPILMLSEEEEKYSKTVKAVIGGMVNQKTMGGMSSSTNSMLYSSSVGQGLSTALDARLEIGLETQPELRLRVMLSLQTEMLQNAFSSSLPSAPLTGLGQNIPSMAATDDELSETHTSLSPTSSNEMLSNAFDDLFAQLLLGRVNLDSLIQLWLTLNEDSTLEEGDNQTLSDSSRVPLIPLSLNSVSSLLACVATMPSLPVRTWVLVFQSLTLLANLKIPCSSDRGADTSPMANAMLADSNLIIVITKFLSGMSNLGPMLSAAQSNQVGPSGTKAFYEFLQRLHVKCADRSIQNLKELMLKLVYSLTADRGAFQIGVGPLDAQCKFLDFILDMSYDNVDISNAISVIESASVLVHQHILCQEKVQCRSSGENLINARSCFGGLFASLLRGGDCRTGVGDTSRDLLMCSLLKLVSRLVSVQNSARGPRSIALATEEHPVGCSDLGPMTDFTKLSQQVLGTATCSSCQSDEEKFGQTDEQKTGHLSGITEREGNHQTASESQGTHLADIILGHRPIMCNLIQALSYCNSNTMAMILGSRGVPNNMQETLEGGDPLSVGDGIYHILVMLFKRCSDARLVLESLFLYLSGGFSTTNGSLVCRLSEPLLWFILKVLDSTRMLSLFFDMGGVEVVCRNIVMCNNRLISTSPSMVSTMMQSMIGKASSIDRKKAWDSELTDGLLNFAPLGTITSSSPTASPAEVLIAASPQHRRARSAAWSYHFYPDEAWVDLTISLPFAILLKEVQIQPHNAALSTCPAHVSLEISHDGVTTFPLCAPMMTSSLASIKLQLQQLEVVASVTIRLHRARDSMTIGLSQILLMGYSAFGDAGMYKTNNIFLPIEDSVSRSSVGWVRLLHHCLTSRRELEDNVAEAAAHISGLLNTCTALLISPTSGMDIPHVETVLVKLGLHSREMGLALVDNLLRSPTYGPESGHPSHYLGKINGMGNNSTVELLYQLGMHQDAWTKDRIQAMLHWLGDSARLAQQKTSGFSGNSFQSTPREIRFSLSEPSPAHIHCIASVLWHSHENNQQNNFSLLISKEIISSLYEWSSVLSTDSSLKEALDYVLCSMCYIQSAYFSQVLEWMGIVISMDINMMAPIPDDRKDSSQYNSASMTDDSKEANNASREQPVNRMTSHHLTETTPFALQDVKHICLDKSNLGTLSRVCKSPVAIKHLLETGFPAVLAQGLFEFCNYIISQFTESWSQSEGVSDSRKTVNGVGFTTSGQSSSELNHKGLSLTATTVAAVLDFLSQISSENAMKDWFGGADGNIFWPVLLTMLCNIPLHSPIVAGTIPQKYELMSVEDRMAIETSTIRFFTHVVSCHVDNQMLFAKVLCDVIKEQGNTVKTGLSVCPLSGFTRRLLLQVLLEDEKVLVAFRADPSQHWTQVFNSANSVQHPRFGAGRQFRTVHVNMHTTFSELVNEVSDMAYLKAAQLLEKKPDETKKDSSQVGLELVEYISSVNSESFSAHNTDKQEKLPSSAGSKSSLPPRPPTRRGRNTADTFAKQFQYQPVLSVYHPFFKHKRLPPGFSVSQLLQVLQQQEECQGQKSLEFTLRLHMRSKDKVSSSSGMFLLEETEDEADVFSDEVLLSSLPFPTALQVFASIGGLALLAEHLPLLYPEISRQITASDMHSGEAAAHDISQEWVQLEPYPEEFYELYEPMSPAPQSGRVPSHPLGTMPTIPPHSLVAFGLFLRLPGYAEVLLKERKKAQCLLRLVLGVTDNGNGGCILTSPISGALPTFPFLVLKSLFDNTPLTTDDGVLLRRMSQDIGVLHLILACLSVLSHHAPRVSSTGFQHETQILLSAMQYTTNPSSSQSASNSVEEKALQQQQQQQHYWAKGTGFGTGSTTSSWDAEQALLRQKSEEEHVTCLLQVLASFINPGGYVPDDFFNESYVPSAEKSLPDIVPDLLSQSCLVPALSSYLRNDSVLDMARHVPLYRALLELMRGLAMCPALVHLLMPLDKQASSGDTGLSVGNLLEKMRGCVDTYANRLKGNKDKAGGGSREEEEENEGLALLIPDIQETARIVHISTERLSKEEDSKRGAAANNDGDVVPRGRPSQKSLDDRYLAIMKRLQFDTYQMVSDEGTTIRFYVRHHYENNVKAAGDIKNPARIRRLAQEAVTLSTSLPLSVSSSVFVRCDEDRLDIMKVLITGPEDTPYANGCFEFDVYFPQDYPIAPPYINLETTGNHTVRFNPNLYNDGKVCLSILNTWHGRPEEKWNSQTSSFLQVLVSIQSLILVSEPYFNEPGYERSRGTPSGTASSREYDANIRQATVKWAMLEQLRNPSPCFREVIQNHFWLKRHRILQQCQVWISEMETYSTDKRTGRTIAHSTMALKRHYNQLREEFARMKPPSGEEEESEEKIDPKEQQYDTDQATVSSQNGSPLLMLDIMATDPNANSVMNPEAVDQIVCSVDHTELDTSVDLTEIDSCLNPPGVPDC